MEFWNVRDKTNAIVIELADEDFNRLILDVEDPAATVAAIQAALDQRAAAAGQAGSKPGAEVRKFLRD